MISKYKMWLGGEVIIHCVEVSPCILYVSSLIMDGLKCRAQYSPYESGITSYFLIYTWLSSHPPLTLHTIHVRHTEQADLPPKKNILNDHL